MTKLGIIGAMDIEVNTLKNAMENVVESYRAGMDFYEGSLYGLPVVLSRSGVGKVHAAMCVQILADAFQVTHLVNTGIAGSLSAELDLGDLVVGKDLMYHDFDCTGFGYPYGQVPGTEITTFPADKTMISYALEAGNQICPGHMKTGRIATGDQFIRDRETKHKIIADTQALCTEMEGAAIAQAAWRNGIPFIVIRAISDKADSNTKVDYEAFESLAAEHCAQLTMELAKKMKNI